MTRRQSERRLRRLERLYFEDPYQTDSFCEDEFLLMCRFLWGLGARWPNLKRAPGFARREYERIDNYCERFQPEIDEILELNRKIRADNERHRREQEEQARVEKKRRAEQQRLIEKETKRLEQEARKAEEQERKRIEQVKREMEEARKRQEETERQRIEDEKRRKREEFEKWHAEELKR